jgi:hypothetical protein
MFICLIFISGCKNEVSETIGSQTAGFQRTGSIENNSLDEASGIQAGSLNEGVLFSHNDDGRPEIFAMDLQGSNLGSFRIKDAINRDWEDISLVPSEFGPLLLLADTGDNFKRYDQIRFNFVKEPMPDDRGRFKGIHPIHHMVELEYPDGPRDCESVAFDPVSGQIYLMSKRDVPARLYSIPLQVALSKENAILNFEGAACCRRFQKVWPKRRKVGFPTYRHGYQCKRNAGCGYHHTKRLFIRPHCDRALD